MGSKHGHWFGGVALELDESLCSLVAVEMHLYYVAAVLHTCWGSLCLVVDMFISPHQSRNVPG